MEKSLKEIIKELGKEYEMEEDVIDNIIKKLQKEFYVKLKHMKNLTLGIWKSLNLPINLFYVINELYQSTLKEQNTNNLLHLQANVKNNTNINKGSLDTKEESLPSQAESQQPKKYINNSIEKNSTVDIPLNNVINKTNDFKPPSKIGIQLEEDNEKKSILSIVHEDLASIFLEINNIDETRLVFKQIHNIINNIAHNPNDEKFRRFNSSKFLSKFKYKSITDFFAHIGFKKVNDFMYLVGEANNMTEIMTELNQFIKANKIGSTFDPYKVQISSISRNDEQIKNSQNTGVNFDDLFSKEIDRRSNIIKASKIERKPKLYLLEKNYSLNRIINTINQKNEDLVSNSKEDKLIIKRHLELLKEKEYERFTLKSRTKLENLMKTPIYIKSDIRLKFPNEQILQGSFALYETIGDIYKFIREYLKDKNEKFNISTTPPLKRYTNMDNTIMIEKLYPNLLMYVNFERKYSGLDDNKTKEIKANLELLDIPDEEKENYITPGIKAGAQ